MSVENNKERREVIALGEKFRPFSPPSRIEESREMGLKMLMVSVETEAGIIEFCLQEINIDLDPGPFIGLVPYPLADSVAYPYGFKWFSKDLAAPHYWFHAVMPDRPTKPRGEREHFVLEITLPDLPKGREKFQAGERAGPGAYHFTAFRPEPEDESLEESMTAAIIFPDYRRIDSRLEASLQKVSHKEWEEGKWEQEVISK